jgi:WhiB family redox-sensing transcriptional regulator
LIVERPEWFAQAACKGQTAVMFSFDAVDQAQAKAICVGCPVIEACLAFALRYREPSGVWGGHTAEERSELRQTIIARRRARQQRMARYTTRQQVTKGDRSSRIAL